MSSEANIYPNHGSNPSTANSDASKANLGFCFSGGGSRALTCAWGQLLGAHTASLMDKPRYISSVSGGTWASSIYTYLPSGISDEDLLGAYYPPQQLSLDGADGTFNVNTLGQFSYGQAPNGTSLLDLATWSALFMITHPKKDYKWMWASIISEFILKPFGLQFEGESIWSSSKYFTLSPGYASNSFPSDSPSIDDFIFVKSGRPFLIMNDNIMQDVQIAGGESSNVVQLPNQATPVSTGARGKVPSEGLSGGGTVESYAYHSILSGTSASSSPVKVAIDQPYSLIDSVSTSSAFFAEALAAYLQKILQDEASRSQLIQSMKESIIKHDRLRVLDELECELKELEFHLDRALLERVEKDLSGIGDFIPTYNYWPIGADSQNQETQYTDGGTLDNTGVLGMLSQTDTGGGEDELCLAVFDNTSTPLQKINNKIIAGSQAAPLFGIDFDVRTGEYKPFTPEQQDPSNAAFTPTSLIAVFDNQADADGKTPFDRLVAGLYAANCGASPGEQPNDSQVNTAPAFYQQTLTTIANPLANVSAGRSVNMLYIQNAKMLNWQNSISAADLLNEIVLGQGSSLDPFLPFKDFPNYSTFTKIGLSAKESNALSQMWAWAISDDASPLKAPFSNFVKSAV